MNAKPPIGSGLFAAALALPGLAATLPRAAQAEAAPAAPELDLRYAHYQDFQPGAERMRVVTPSLFVLLPLSDAWSLKASYTRDSLSGASPLLYNALSGASGVGVHDIRRAGDAELTRYFGRVAVAVGAAVSREDDYDSNAAHVRVALDSADHDRTLTFGLGASEDTIDPVNGLVNDRPRHVLEGQVGFTQVLTRDSLASVAATWVHGSGYFNDPYKPLDTRPDQRDQGVLLARYNRFFEQTQIALRTSYRFYADSWDVRAHTLEVAAEKALPHDFALTPSVRYYTQSAASFYRDPPFPEGFVAGHPYSADTRLAAFGAFTLALELGAPLPGGWRADGKFAFYQQRSGWRVLGSGSPGIEPLSARIFELGLRKTF